MFGRTSGIKATRVRFICSGAVLCFSVIFCLLGDNYWCYINILIPCFTEAWCSVFSVISFCLFLTFLLFLFVIRFLLYSPLSFSLQSPHLLRVQLSCSPHFLLISFLTFSHQFISFLDENPHTNEYVLPVTHTQAKLWEHTKYLHTHSETHTQSICAAPSVLLSNSRIIQ